MFPLRKGLGSRGVQEVEVRSVVQGRIVEVVVAVGDTVSQGDEVAFVESMKMEVPVHAPSPGRVESVLVAVGDAVEEGTALMVLA
jgi:acetyl-CoA carboxylase biotin carboxyl carrier protein